ncbi:unnamed protein product [Arabis nemorensis]|uniref:TIR domain-containing protein n=1 Tax=Arabis nemorensis TaxID=586526 RepID=A0A565AQI4_9BRAS|nr:unnamed protein product [Arabis nemorensis]
MESYKLGEIKVIPIFYGVDPSDVRHQRRSFGLGNYRGRVTADKVLGWEEALNLVAGLSGVDSSHCADDATMVKGIVEDISSQLASMQPTPLDDLGRRFPAHCFIANVDQTCEEDNLREVQHQFLCDILSTKQVRKIMSVQSGAKLIQSRLANLKVFIVLDGVEKVEQLNALAKETSWFGQGSRIIITTRNKRLLDSCRVTTVHEVQCLESEESLKMLKNFAFEGGVPPGDAYEGLAIRASQLAQGLPLALKAFSLYLRGISSIEQWEDTSDTFETAPHGDIMNALLSSYFSLDMRSQTNFLRVACLFNKYTSSG